MINSICALGKVHMKDVSGTQRASASRQMDSVQANGQRTKGTYSCCDVIHHGIILFLLELPLEEG